MMGLEEDAPTSLEEIVALGLLKAGVARSPTPGLAPYKRYVGGEGRY